MSRRPKAPPPPSRDQISRYFKPTSLSSTTDTLKPPCTPVPETTSSTSLSCPTAAARREPQKIESMFHLVAIRKKTQGAKQPLRKMLSAKVKCDAKVDPNADKVWEDKYKPDVNLTTDEMLSEARKLQRVRKQPLNLQLSYPWLWWQCWFEARESRWSYYEARRNHGVLCSCCENARYREGFRVGRNNLCDDCANDKLCLHYPCSHLTKLIEKRETYRRALPRRINVITTREVIDMKLQSEVTS